jgi:putative thioredoxin
MVDSPWVVDVSSATFQQIVVEGSRERPVVIDFWAEWCGPCRRLGPLLEKLAIERAGGFLLAKVNTDENPDLAQAFQIDGIPAVFAIRDGKLVNRFTGLLPEDELGRFLDTLGTESPPTPKEPNPLELALELEGRDPQRAIEAYRKILLTEPEEPAARVGLARVLLATPGDEQEAAALLAGMDFGDYAQEAKRLSGVILLRTVPHGDADYLSAQSGTTPEQKLILSQILAARGDYTAALAALLEAADGDRQLGRTSVRELMLKIFEVIGPRSEQADDYRRRLQSLLY